ncbi:MAG TPA: hypothetical protein VLX28_01655 [Thermoanaerobaculia bacterium]|nr:hypothetical protein [Thermoanaerobaculia bacterium]
MRFSKGIQIAILLALCSRLPARGAEGCSEGAQYGWLSSCAWTLFEVRRAETPKPKDGWPPDVLFRPKDDLSAEFVEACSQLVAEPERLPAKPMMPLKPLLADPCTRDEHLRWLQSCEKDALDLPGRTRADLLATFFRDGGFGETYVHKRCSYLKVNVDFSLTVEGAESPDDVIESVSLPYVEAINFG